MLRLHRRLHFRRAPIAEAKTPRAAGRDSVCPYLAGAGAGVVSQHGRCTRSGAASPIHLGYQSVHCVSSRHERCPVFLGLRDSPLAPNTSRPRRWSRRQARRSFLIASAVAALTLPLIVTAGAIWSPVPETTRVERPATLEPSANLDEPRIAAALPPPPPPAIVAPEPQARLRDIPDPAEQLVRARALAEEQAALNIAFRVPAAITPGEPGPIDLLFTWEQFESPCLHRFQIVCTGRQFRDGENGLINATMFAGIQLAKSLRLNRVAAQ